MSEETKEKLSAYIDDELQTGELPHIDRQLESDAELRNKLNRYALISETIKGNCNHCDAASIADRVNDSLTNEPAILAPVVRKRPTNQWKTYLGGAAIAASVAALAIINIGSLNQQNAEVEVFPVTADINTATGRTPFAAGFSQKASTQWSTDSNTPPEIEDELNQLLIDHSEYTTQSGIPGLLPYATFVVYDKK